VNAAAPARREPLAGYAPAAVGLLSAIAVFCVLEGLIRAGVISEYIMPPPSHVLAAFGRVITEEHIVRRFFLTIGECLTTGVMITVFGVAGGVLLHRYRLLQQAVETWVAALAAAPVVLAYPLFMVIFGRNAWTIIMIGFVAALPPVILKTVEGLAGTRNVLLDVGRSFRLDDWQLFRKILLPAALPSIFVGLRVGLIFALINIVGVEFLINFGGLGQLINELAERYDLPGTYGAIGFVILVSVLFFVACERAERWLLPA